MRHAVRGLFWNEVLEIKPNSLAGFVQVSSDKAVTSLTSQVCVAYLVHIVLLNLSYRF